jgi:lysophospholipase L1-like esterase
MPDDNVCKTPNTRAYVAIWIRGAALATLLAWLVAPSFHNRMLQREWEPQLDCYVQPAGFEMTYRKEGWAKTRYGKYGIGGIDDATTLGGEKVLLWGDSFIEALQVQDQDKVAQQLTAIWSSRHPEEELHGIGVGMGGRCVADYYFLIPAYEKLLDPICHIVVIPTLDDITPDGIAFKSDPEFQFVRRVPRGDSEIKIRRVLGPFRAELVFVPARDLANRLRVEPIRLSPGVAQEIVPQKIGDDIAPTDCVDQQTRDAWRFVLRSLKQQTSLPIVFVFIPKTPWLQDGHIVVLPKSCPAIETLQDICCDEGVGFISTADSFEAAFHESNRFCRGFSNSQIDRGHLNELGHQKLAEQLCNYLESNWDELHAN